MSEPNELNKDHIINSLRSQLSNYVIMVAEREALIEQIGKENKDLKEGNAKK